MIDFWFTHWLQILFFTTSFGCLFLLLYVLFVAKSNRLFTGSWLVILVSVVGLLLYGISNMYTGAGINEATWFHLGLGLSGLTWVQIEPLAMLGAFTVFSLGALFGASIYLFRKRNTLGGHVRNIVGIWVLVLCVNPGFVQLSHMVYLFLDKPAAIAELRSKVHPVDVSRVASSGSPKSLVYIYAEGFEAAFLDQKRFPGLAPNLRRLSEKGVYIEGIGQSPYTGWTSAGMAASQCGLPVLSKGQYGLSGLPIAKVNCVPHVLKAKEYRLAYLNGSDLAFGEKGDFYRRMGFDWVAGGETIADMAAAQGVVAPMFEWGAHDDALFHVAYGKFLDMQSKGGSFALMMLTLDTHAPSGHVNPSCENFPAYADGSSKMLNAVHCSDHQIGAFVERVLEVARDDVVVVVSSDHLQPDVADVRQVLGHHMAGRSNLWLAVGSGIKPERIKRSASMFDVAPTLLSLLGWNVPSVNLGRDLRRPQPTLSEQMGAVLFFTKLKSAFITFINRQPALDMEPKVPATPHSYKIIDSSSVTESASDS